MGLVRVTPLVRDGAAAQLGERVALKLENLQRTGSFKLRGAVRAVAALGAAARRAGLVAASAGNHGAGMALACARAGVPLAVVVPEGAPQVKRAAIAGQGAEVVVEGGSYDEAEAAARKLARARGARFVSPFDDEEVVEGNGSDLARELVRQAPDLGRVIAPVGGGGLLGGLARVLAPRGVEVIGVQPEGNCAMRESLAAGRALTVYGGRPTLAEGCEGAICELTYDLARRHGARVEVVSEEAIGAAVAWLYRRVGTVAEPTGAVAVAGLLAGAARPAGERTTAVIVSGGNIDPELLDELLAAHID